MEKPKLRPKIARGVNEKLEELPSGPDFYGFYPFWEKCRF